MKGLKKTVRIEIGEESKREGWGRVHKGIFAPKKHAKQGENNVRISESLSTTMDEVSISVVLMASRVSNTIAQESQRLLPNWWAMVNTLFMANMFFLVTTVLFGLIVLFMFEPCGWLFAAEFEDPVEGPVNPVFLRKIRMGSDN